MAFSLAAKSMRAQLRTPVSRPVCIRVVAKAAAKVSKTVKQVSSTNTVTPQLGFTKSNELFVGRLAMMGFASSLIGELLTGKGALAQFGYEVGLDTIQVDWFIVALIGFNAIAALLPTSGTFVPEERESLKERPKGALQDPKITIFEPKKFFGISEFGFTKANELFVGRVAQLGFAASLIGEVVTGKGPLAQFDFETGIPLQDTEFGLLVFIAFFALAAVNEGSGKFVDE